MEAILREYAAYPWCRRGRSTSIRRSISKQWAARAAPIGMRDAIERIAQLKRVGNFTHTH